MENVNDRESHRYAGLMPRFFALIIDFVILSLLFFPITKIVKGKWIMDIGDHQWVSGWFVTDPICIIFLVIIVMYFILFEAFAGATPGKMLTGIRVVNINGGNPGLAKSIVRNILRLIDGLPVFCIIGIILIAKSSERARFGDRIAGTRVIITSRNRL
ncbi:MAG: RDD family protein [Candidatus Zixiibacteriota bacterium]